MRLRADDVAIEKKSTVRTRRNGGKTRGRFEGGESEKEESEEEEEDTD